MLIVKDITKIPNVDFVKIIKNNPGFDVKLLTACAVVVQETIDEINQLPVEIRYDAKRVSDLLERISSRGYATFLEDATVLISKLPECLE